MILPFPSAFAALHPSHPDAAAAQTDTTYAIRPHLLSIPASAHMFVLLFPPLSLILVVQATAMAEYRRKEYLMQKNEVCEMLDTLSSELYNEIETHLDGFLDEKTTVLAQAIQNAVKSTREKLYGREDAV